MFDLRVEIVDPATGKVTQYQPYVMRVSGDGTFFERPPGSGYWYEGNGKLYKEPSEDQKKAFAAKQNANSVFRIGNRVFSTQAEMDQYVTELENKLAQTSEPVVASEDPGMSFQPGLIKEDEPVSEASSVTAKAQTAISAPSKVKAKSKGAA